MASVYHKSAINRLVIDYRAFRGNNGMRGRRGGEKIRREKAPTVQTPGGFISHFRWPAKNVSRITEALRMGMRMGVYVSEPLNQIEIINIST